MLCLGRKQRTCQAPLANEPRSHNFDKGFERGEALQDCVAKSVGELQNRARIKTGAKCASCETHHIEKDRAPRLVRSCCEPTAQYPADPTPLVDGRVHALHASIPVSGCWRCRTWQPAAVLLPCSLWLTEREVPAAARPSHRPEPSFGMGHTRTPRNPRPEGCPPFAHADRSLPPSRRLDGR